ncbi:MAG TPA: apolipoprotein N-acyltransferase [Pirellulales bacterium]|jgi:apolipoprotein N-acyltransferase|nr:apolipoprotein N-acyltransferase [Pirellulales bacterium]
MNPTTQPIAADPRSSLAQADAPSATASEKPPGTWAVVGEMSIDMALPISAGALVAISFMPPPLSLVAWVGLVPFAAAIARAKGTFELYAGAYLGGLLMDLHALDFIRTRLSGSGLAGSHTADWLVNACIWALIWPATLFFGRRFVGHTRLPMFLALPIIWISGEFLRSEMGWIISCSPFPWLQLGITQAPYLHIIQVADLGGVWAIAFVIAAANGALFEAVVTRRVKPLAIGLVIFSATWAYGEFRLRGTDTSPGPTVALVPVSGKTSVNGKLPLEADVLLWSETTRTARVDESAAESIKPLEALARSSASTLIVGCVRKHGDLQFNSAAVVDPDRGYVGCYDKCYLVPWSEFRPWKWTGLGMQSADLENGNAQPVFDIGQFTCGVSICYDICFSQLYRAFSPEPDFFACCSRETADPTGFLPRTLLNMTRLRAVENRRAFVRNVEGGFSGIVSSTGEYTSAPERPWTAAVSVGPIPIDRRTTFARFGGDWLPISCCLAIASALVRSRRRA